MIGWVDIPVADMPRAISFYEKMLTCELTSMDLANGLKMAMIPGEEEIPFGALVYAPETYQPGTEGPLVYIRVTESLDAVASRIPADQLLLPKVQISDQMGYRIVLTDSEGNRIALLGPA